MGFLRLVFACNIMAGMKKAVTDFHRTPVIKIRTGIAVAVVVIDLFLLLTLLFFCCCCCSSCSSSLVVVVVVLLLLLLPLSPALLLHLFFFPFCFPYWLTGRKNPSYFCFCFLPSLFFLFIILSD